MAKYRRKQAVPVTIRGCDCVSCRCGGTDEVVVLELGYERVMRRKEFERFYEKVEEEDKPCWQCGWHEGHHSIQCSVGPEPSR